jgi:hypothetical protein
MLRRWALCFTQRHGTEHELAAARFLHNELRVSYHKGRVARPLLWSPYQPREDTLARPSALRAVEGARHEL